MEGIAKRCHSGAVRSVELWCAIAHLRISRFRVRADARPGMTASNVQFLVVAEDPLIVERNPSFAFQISLDLRPRGDAVAQADQSGNLLLERLHPFREGIA